MSDGLQRKILHQRNMHRREVTQELQQNYQVTSPYSTTFVDHTKQPPMIYHIQAGHLKAILAGK